MVFISETSGQEAILASNVLADLGRSEQFTLVSSGDHEPIIHKVTSGWYTSRSIQMHCETASFGKSWAFSPVLPDEARFENLVRQWKEESQFLSFVTQMAMLPSYQQIIGMGPAAVPLILRQMAKEGDDPDHWHWALVSITGEDPVPEGALGDTRRMAASWFSWAHGRYIF